MILRLLRTYLHEPQLKLAQATSFLRLVFVVTFMGQLVVAMATGLILRLAVPDVPEPANDVLGWVLVLISLPHLPLVLFLSTRGTRALNRGASLSSTLLAGVLLSTPAWFLSLALITRQAQLHLFLLLAILVFQYALGMLLVSRFARLLIPARPEAGVPDDGQAAASGLQPGSGQDVREGSGQPPDG